MSEDFFVYYRDAGDDTGILQAVSSTCQNIDLPFIRIPYELGIRFTLGKESPSTWHIRRNPAKDEMEFTRKGDQPETGHKRGFRRIPEPQETEHEPDIIVTWHKEKNMFVVTGNKLVDAAYRYLDFFVTGNCDPNILHFGFKVSTANIAKGATATCNLDLPDDFSIFTRMYFDNYLLRKEP